ncbi:two-component system, NtrC family, C4-dicarboxylate transport sensor histidine kinase DctB [Cognatiyoonia koreensis]|uniref:C4-dicarboxylate transport sensor protein DctB n=1 Tax=Cognatiyoonia koreensis TaxID=364200 RepID=A0A1I0PQW2_9RHOB|nr:ATP-binding protein [Cognatiyoonia koreensis]SEW16748.1 two-component system, NtrC family, C4-dicarboxylate transport sensor histidine kinase DctB [Cognatiyoonia koreensis]
MNRYFGRRSAVAVLFVLLVAVFAAGVWRFAYISALDQLARKGQADLALAADGLTGQLERYRELAVLLADHPDLQPAIRSGIATDETKSLLLSVADKTGSLDIAVLDSTGREVATARDAGQVDHAGRPYFERAMDGALGVFHLFSSRYQKRAFLFAAPVFSEEGPAIGSVLVTANVEAVEAAWRGDRPTLFFTDELGVVFLSNRSELVFRSRMQNDVIAGDTAEYPPDQLTPFISVTPEPIAGRDLWRVDGGRYLPEKALHLDLPMPVIGMVGEVLIDVDPAEQLATLQAAVAAALCLTFGLLLFWVAERRRTLALANLRLEARVADRTADLERVNADLRREILTRTDAEAQLKRAQAELVQAGKLSALGQMSAGISHELNQPLMAIRSFAENGQAFLARDKPQQTSENLGRISELARRMGRIIQNLRAFARQESAPVMDIDIVSVIHAVIEISGPRARQADVDLVWSPPRTPIMVRGGDVRLQQVLLNLVGNAIDAMEQTAKKRVEIGVAVAARVEVTVRDTGPGIAEPEKIFDPFYSTKAVSDAEGMGLGLSISYGLVQSFGGAIRGRNHPDGGAVFTIELDRAAAEVAA